MLTIILRIVLVLILVVAASLGHLTKMLFGFEAGLVVLLVCFFGLQTAIPLGALALSAPGFLRIAPPQRRWLASAREVLEFWRAFVLLMPFENFWMSEEKPLAHAPDDIPVVLIPGYACNRALWFDLKRDLEEAGRQVAAVTFAWPFADIDLLARQLEQRIALVREQTGATQVLLVGHSLGGLVARAYLARHGGAGVAGLITLATPHHGARLAKFAPGPCGRQMEAKSAWLAALNAQEPPVPVHAFWSGRDEFVSPPESARLPGAGETCAPLYGHYSVLRHPDVLKKVLSASAAPAKAKETVADTVSA
ncbi:triacylglycerol lipase [Rhodoblastus sphagnicola]|nr:alpha/beta fold hydrolase [Rhodoblastus sphagnicola]MBB4196790.1 triacylglycerol lipase [Rhodoblastus sphagnicola]